MDPSVHDNKLISYTVNETLKQISFETVFDEKVTNEYVNVVFEGVAAYLFEDHSLSLGTILYGIDEVDPNQIVDKYWDTFEKGKPYGWPGPWGETKAKASDFFKAQIIRGFEIGSSCGLCGWVLAKSMKVQAKDQS